MKLANSFTLSLSAAFLVCLAPQLSAAQNSTPETEAAGAATQQLVPAEVDLNRTIDARSDQTGSRFEAQLDGTVQLTNGTELPNGTELVGQVTADRMNSNGPSRLALQFTEAKLRNGEAIPIEATIVGMAGPAALTENVATYDGPLPWNGIFTHYQDIGVLSGVDMHSRIGGVNSGTLVGTDRSDMKLDAGSRMSLALGKRSSD
jgi:hypothetical protein